MRRYVLLALAAVACPCHLPITIPLLVALLGGTALGGVIAGQEGLLLGVGGVFLTLLFIGSLGGFIYYAGTSDRKANSTASQNDPVSPSFVERLARFLPVLAGVRPGIAQLHAADLHDRSRKRADGR